MSDFIVQKFLGLDTRRSEVTSAPGTLFTLENCHVNQGAEIEKRKEFQKLLLPTGTFGIESVSSGLVTFGSGITPFVFQSVSVSRTSNIATIVLSSPPPWMAGIRFKVTGFTGGDSTFNVFSSTAVLTVVGTSITYNNPGPNVSSTPDTNGTVTYRPGTNPNLFITYQRLAHPDGSTAMTGVAYSCVFEDKCFVLATFADGKTFAFYDGSIVNDFKDGLITSILAGNNPAIASEIVAEINRSTGYTAIIDPSVNTDVVISGKNNAAYSLATNVTSASGTLAAIKNNLPQPAGLSSNAVGTFNIVNCVGFQTSSPPPFTTPSITSIQVNGAEILYGAPDAVYMDRDSLDGNSLASKVALAINRKSAASGYSAESQGSQVSITSVAPGTTPNGYEVKVTTNYGIVAIFNFGAINCDLCYITLGAVVTNPTLTLTSITVNGGSNIMSRAFAMPADGADITSFLEAVMIDINTKAASPYVCTQLASDSTGQTMALSRKVCSSSDPASVNVVITYTPTTGTPVFSFTNFSPGFSAVASPAGAAVTNRSWSGVITVVANGGTAPYTYKWTYVSGNTAIIPTNYNAASTQFQTPGNTFTGYTAVWECVVTDSSATPKVANSNLIYVEKVTG